VFNQTYLTYLQVQFKGIFTAKHLEQIVLIGEPMQSNYLYEQASRRV